MSVTHEAPAKINLFLNIVNRREDGYHEIETLFQRIDLCDRISFEANKDDGLELNCSGIPIDLKRPEENLILRACRSLEDFAKNDLSASFSQGLRIDLEKKIPLGGGLGGGSSDAATTLMALNDIFDLRIGDAALAKIATELGADVSFFLGPPAAIGRGVGERLTPISHTSEFFAVLAFPKFGVSTAEVYGRFDPTRPHEEGDLDGLADALLQGDLHRTLALAFNSMEDLAFAIKPELGALREELEHLADCPVRMSGSGSTLFTLSENESEAKRITERWQNCAACQIAKFI